MILFRWTRQSRTRTWPRYWRPWWLLGLLEVATYPMPHRQTERLVRIDLPAVRAVHAFNLSEIPARTLYVLAAA